MSTIELSSGWTNAMVARLLGHNQEDTQALATLPSFSALLAGLAGSPSTSPYFPKARLVIMKGVVPTSLVGLSLINDRASDALVSFTTPTLTAGGDTAQYFSMVTANVNPAIINSNYKVADASGTATWFRWLVTAQLGGTGAPSILVHQIVGSITAIGGGGDLEMASTDIIAGQQYRISSLRLLFPTMFEF